MRRDVDDIFFFMYESVLFYLVSSRLVLSTYRGFVVFSATREDRD